MTHSEIYRIILDCLGTPRTTIDELGYDALCEKIEGIMGNNQVVPSNLPSKDEFLSKAKDDYCRGTGFNCTIENLYNWLVSKLPASNNSKEINELKNEAAEPASEDYIEKPFDLGVAKEHPEWLYTRDGCKARILCDDFKDSCWPIIAAYEIRPYGKEEYCTYRMDGRYNPLNKRTNDLVLRVPKPKKVKKWIVTFADPFDNEVRHPHDRLFDSLEEAKTEWPEDTMGHQYHEIEVEES